MRRLAVLTAALTVSACSTFSSGPPPTRSYRLVYPAPAAETTTPLGIVRVGPFGSAQVYDRLPFVYRDGVYEVGVDNYNAWITAPSGMLGDLLARDLAASGIASAVLQGASALPADYELSGRIEEIEERPAGGCTAHLRVRALFVHVQDKGPRQVIFEDTFENDQPCTAGDPDSFAEAMSRAAESVSAQVRARIAGR